MPPRLDSLASYGSTTTHAVNINGGASMYFARKDGSPRRGLALGGTKAPLPGAADLLEPKFITERNTHRALVLPGDGGFLIKRYPTLGKHETMLVSRLRRDGTLGWSREMPDANISWAKLVGARLVLVRGGAQILGIEPKSGKIAWRYQP